VVVQNLEIVKIASELAGGKAEGRERFARLGNVDDGEDDAAGNYAAFGRLEEIALEVVAHRDEIPRVGLDDVLSLFEVGDAGVDGGIASGEDVNCRAGAVDSGDAPTSGGEPEGVAAGSASEVESASGSEIAGAAG